MLGEALPPRSYQRNLEELDALLGGSGNYGFDLSGFHSEDEQSAAEVIADEDDEGSQLLGASEDDE